MHQQNQIKRTLALAESMGVLGKNQTGAKTRGLHLHSTFVVTTGGLPLGVLNAQFSAPQPKSETYPPTGEHSN